VEPQGEVRGDLKEGTHDVLVARAETLEAVGDRAGCAASNRGWFLYDLLGRDGAWVPPLLHSAR
jgi:hypothetical protein